MRHRHIRLLPLVIVALMFWGILSSGGIEWYQALSLPFWSPPEAVITIVWAIIYALAAFSSYKANALIWEAGIHDSHFRRVNLGFLAVTTLNLLWSTLFFTLHSIYIAVWCAVALAATIAILIVTIWPKSRVAASALIPYFVWVVFATHLNYVLGTLNVPS